VEVGAGKCFSFSGKSMVQCSPRIMDVARDFPQCSAVAVDLVPMQSPYARLDPFVAKYLRCPQIDATELQV
jgi:hypothetical protein